MTPDLVVGQVRSESVWVSEKSSRTVELGPTAAARRASADPGRWFLYGAVAGVVAFGVVEILDPHVSHEQDLMVAVAFTSIGGIVGAVLAAAGLVADTPR